MMLLLFSFLDNCSTVVPLLVLFRCSVHISLRGLCTQLEPFRSNGESSGLNTEVDLEKLRGGAFSFSLVRGQVHRWRQVWVFYPFFFLPGGGL